MGEREEAKSLDRTGVVRSIPDDAQAQYNVACTWSQLGEVDRALDLLEGWAKQGGVLARNWLERDPDLDAIRSIIRATPNCLELDCGERTRQKLERPRDPPKQPRGSKRWPCALNLLSRPGMAIA